jgi:hypothetical protein
MGTTVVVGVVVGVVVCDVVTVVVAVVVGVVVREVVGVVVTVVDTVVVGDVRKHSTKALSVYSDMMRFKLFVILLQDCSVTLRNPPIEQSIAAVVVNSNSPTMPFKGFETFAQDEPAAARSALNEPAVIGLQNTASMLIFVSQS